MGQPLVTFTKGLFLIFNFVFWISGLALLIVGIMAKFTFKYFMKLSTDIDYNLAPYVMIGCGIFIVLVGFCGCWAAVKQHNWILKLYIFIMILLVFAEIAGAVAGYVLKGKMSDGLKGGLNNAVKNYYSDKDLKSAIDEVQARYVKCCGVNSYKDYFTTSSSTTSLPFVTTTASITNASSTSRAPTTVASTLMPNTTVVSQNTTLPVNSTSPRKRRDADDDDGDDDEKESVPMSCCKNSDGSSCHYKNLKGLKPEEMGIYTEGCYDGLLKIAKKNFGIVGGVALGIAILQLLGIACAYSLTVQFKKINKYETM